MKIILITLFCFFSLSKAQQVGISTDHSFRADSRTLLHVKKDDFAVKIPKADNTSVLPAIGTGTLGSGTEGSVIYNDAAGVIVQSDGTKWNISDPIVIDLKNNKLARFVKSVNNLTSSCGTCGILLTGYTCAFQTTTCTATPVPLKISGDNAFNDIPNDVELITVNAPSIRFKTSGLYRLTFSSIAHSSAPAFCAAVGPSVNVDMNLQLQAGGTGAFVPINTTSSSKALLDVTNPLISLLGTQISHSVSNTYVGTFNAGDVVQYVLGGNQALNAGACNALTVGGNLNIRLDGTGSQNAEVIIEKITMQ